MCSQRAIEGADVSFADESAWLRRSEHKYFASTSTSATNEFKLYIPVKVSFGTSRAL